MLEDVDKTSLYRRLREMSAQTRVQLIHSELSLGFTLCTTAETELLYGQFDQARRTAQMVRPAAYSLRRRLAEPNHVPRSLVHEIRRRLTQLEGRILRLESRLTLH